MVAVIELDDRTHESPIRQAADARKNKALADAGIRLIRIPAGPLPPPDSLRNIIDSEPRASIQTGMDPLSAEELIRCANDLCAVSAEPLTHHGWVASRNIRRAAMRLGLIAATMVFGWFVYAQVLPRVVQSAFQPLAAKLRAIPVVSQSADIKLGLAATVIAVPSKQELETKQHADSLAIAELRREREQAWNGYYGAPVSCEHPATWGTQVECGNKYMRAKKDFDERWSRDHGAAIENTQGVVLSSHATDRAVRVLPP